MKKRGILFSSAMVQAILEGRKTQTRRIVKPQPVVGDEITDAYGGWMVGRLRDSENAFRPIQCPYGMPGEQLWVKETFARLHDGLLQNLDPEPDNGEPFNNGWSTAFKADGEPADWKHYGIHWKPSIFMPRKLSRITLEVIGIRVERLQDISDEDAKAEGSYLGRCSCSDAPTHIIGMKFNQTWCHIHGEEYKSLWESINGKGSWSKNPWVWVIQFKKL